MDRVTFFDRKEKKIIEEKVYYREMIEFLYKDSFLSNIALKLVSKTTIFSKLYGYLNTLKSSRKKITPFIKEFQLNEEEFLKKTENFTSFNDFFIRKLKDNIRKINYNENVLILPCDGRVLVYPNIQDIQKFSIKNQTFSFEQFLQDNTLIEKYKNGSMLIARLAPQDYHRFHFPCDCVAEDSKLITGLLFSVNPIAIKRNINIFSENKRMLTLLHTKKFKDVLYIEVGATNVGSITQTYRSKTECKKGDEKGFFSLGGSSVILLFEPNSITFDQDLLEQSNNNIETKAFFGESFAKKI